MSFASLKKRKKDLNALAEKMKKSASSGVGKNDPRMWYPERDKQGNGRAVIRFLPPPEGMEMPYVKIYQHFFKGPGGWYTEECPTTIEKDCPVCEANTELWDTGVDANKKLASSRKRNLSYYCNVYIVDDPATPENNGQVKIFRFGSKIFEMIMSRITPEFDDVEPIDPFDFWEGANFNLRIRKDKDGNTTYDRSSWADASQLLPTDEELEAVWKKEYNLEKEFYSKIKEYDELKKKLDKVLKKSIPSTTADELEEETEDETEEKMALNDRMDEKVDNSPQTEEPEDSSDDEDVDDTLAYFEKLANG